MNVLNRAQEYSDSPQFMEDQRFEDTRLPYMITPSFLSWNPRDMEQSSVAHDMLLKQFPWSREGVLKMDAVTYDQKNNYRHPCNTWLNKRYNFNTQRCMYKGREWVESHAMLVWHLPNGYRLHAMSADPKANEEISPGYYYLNLLYRHKNDAHKPRTGANDMMELIKYLETMPGAPPAVFYWPQQIDSYGSPHLEHLEYERALNTGQLTKLWARKLGGIEVPGSRYWLASRYRPADPAIIPEEQKYDKFEKILSQMD